MQREQLRKSRCNPGLSLPLIAVLVAGCEGIGGGALDPQHHQPPPFESTELMFSDDAFSGPWDGATTLLNDKVKLRGRMEPYADNPGLKLGLLIDDVKQKNGNAGNNGTEPFRGLGGAYYHSFLKAAKGKAGADQSYDAFATASIELQGRITEYEFSRFGADKGNGRLVVETVHTVSHEVGQVEQRRFKWVIRIKQQGYHIHSHTGNPSDPFPGTLYFDSAMLQRIATKGYNVKLHADGNGFIVEEIWVGDSMGGVPQELNSMHPEWQQFKALKNPSNFDCIDIFLALPDNNSDGLPDDLDDIPTNHDDLIDDFYYAYCLGRCQNPAIVNSR